MHKFALDSFVVLFYLLVLIPVLALLGAKRFNATPPQAGEPPRKPLPPFSKMMQGTLLSLALLFALSWLTARTFDYHIFAVPKLGAREIFAGLAALAICVFLVFVSRAIRSAEEIRNMPANRLMPKTRDETVLFSLVALAAGVSEEAAYRGVLMNILWYWLGSPWIAVCIAALAFAIAHAVQGWKSGVIILVVAFIMHALVWFTGTLVIAMVVHAVYDLALPTIRRKLLRESPTDLERSAG